MKKTAIIFGVVAGALSGLHAQEYLSLCDMDLSRDGRTLYVTAATGHQIISVDAASGLVGRKVTFPEQLSGGTLSVDGETMYVTGGGYYGHVYEMGVASGKIGRTIPVGHTPASPVLSPDGKTLFVCNRFDNDVSYIDLKTGKDVARVPVLREPVSVDITPDGKTLFVANHNPDGPADVDYVASKVSVIDVASKSVTTIKLVNGSEGVREIKISDDGKYVYVTHLMARFLVPTTQLERGWVSTDALSVIRVADQKLIYTVLLDDLNLGFPNPWAVDFSDDGKRLVVSSAGAHEVSVIDLPALMAKIAEKAEHVSEEAHLDAHNDLSFLSGIRKRVPLKGNGPRALVVKGEEAYVANYFTDTIDVVDLAAYNVVKTIELNPGMEITQVRQGEIFFNDADLCFQKWLSCVTCHPEARTDALNWDLLNDGIGNPKNVKSMLLSHKTPRAMWLGVRADAETGVRAGLKYIQFAVRPEEDALAIDAYLKSLTPEMSPYLENGKLSESGERGKKLFEDLGCAVCHPAPLYTDLKMYEVGTTKGQDKGRPVDVPSLIEAWRTAPYLHDGRAATVGELLRSKGHADILKMTNGLDEEQLQDLETYILSL